MQVHNLTADVEQFTANAYLLATDAPVLVDVGVDAGIVDRITEHVDALEAVVITHQHRDHIAALDAVLDAFDPSVHAYAPHDHRTAALGDGETLTVGGLELTALHTPGHAADHLVLLTEQALFSGDLVVYNDGAFDDGSFGRTDQPGQDRAALVASIEHLLTQLSPTVTAMYPGHGDSITDMEVRTVVDRALTRAKRFEPKYP
ncbi:MAG: MBL fold metallo-hydrolase [Haloquadratum sp.]|nr:MBL fold metallo-hydrolase [Haloquadratum sp.]